MLCFLSYDSSPQSFSITQRTRWCTSDGRRLCLRCHRSLTPRIRIQHHKLMACHLWRQRCPQTRLPLPQYQERRARFLSHSRCKWRNPMMLELCADYLILLGQRPRMRDRISCPTPKTHKRSKLSPCARATRRAELNTPPMVSPRP